MCILVFRIFAFQAAGQVAVLRRLRARGRAQPWRVSDSAVSLLTVEANSPCNYLLGSVTGSGMWPRSYGASGPCLEVQGSEPGHSRSSEPLISYAWAKSTVVVWNLRVKARKLEHDRPLAVETKQRRTPPEHIIAYPCSHFWESNVRHQEARASNLQPQRNL